MDAQTDTPVSDTAEGFQPPYFSFQTFWGFIESLAERPLPPMIDRSILSTKSGTDQLNLLTAFKSFGFITDDQTVTPLLEQFVAGDSESRPKYLATLLRAFYTAQLELSERNGTATQLNESFTETFGIRSADTRRKAVTFFLHAAKTAGLPLSPHFPQTRSSSGTAQGRPRRSPAKGRRNATIAGPETIEAEPMPAPPSTNGNLHPFLLGLIKELPEDGGSWTEAKREGWLAMAKLTVDMLYTVEN